MERHILLLLLLSCFYSCDNEDASIVNFSCSEIQCSEFQNEINIGVTANCSWSIICDNWITALSPEGSSDANVLIRVQENKGYEERNGNIILRSSDGTASDTIIISQKFADYLASNQSPSEYQIKPDGDEFSIEYKSNIKDLEINKPNWIDYIDSRSINDYCLKFKVGVNKEAKERHGIISIKGNNSVLNYNITQQSYSPNSIEVHNWKDICTSLGEYHYDISVSPLYSDLSKIQISSSDESVCEAKMSNDKLVLVFKSYGNVTIKMYVDDKELWHSDILCADITTPLYADIYGTLNAPVLLEDIIYIAYNKDQKLVELSTLTPENIEITSNTSFKTKKEGKGIIRARYILTGKYSDVEFEIVKTKSHLNIVWYSEQTSGNFICNIRAYIKSNLQLEHTTFIISRYGDILSCIGADQCVKHMNYITCYLTNVSVEKDYNYIYFNEQLTAGFSAHISYIIDGKAYYEDVNMDQHDFTDTFY